MPHLYVKSITSNIVNWIFQSTTVQQMSSSVPVVTSVSMATTAVMACLTAPIAQTREPAVSVEIALSQLEREDVLLAQLIVVIVFPPFSDETPRDVPP